MEDLFLWNEKIMSRSPRRRTARTLKGFPVFECLTRNISAGHAESNEDKMFSKASAPMSLKCAFLINVLHLVCRAWPPKTLRENCKNCRIALAAARPKRSALARARRVVPRLAV